LTTIPPQPLFIVGDVVQLREAIFQSFPARRASYETNRQAYREETIRLYDEAGHDALPDILYRLSHILHWEPTSVSLRTRRGLARYRLRDLAGAHEDLTHAILLSTRDLDGTPDQHDPDLDALRARALVREEMHDHKTAMEDITTVLRRSPRDVLALSLRASIRGNAGNLRGAQADLSSTNVAISSQTAYQSRIGQADVDLEYLARGWAYISVSAVVYHGGLWLMFQ
jgi:tetratricopeptide (TPR) repeat protein